MKAKLIIGLFFASVSTISAQGLSESFSTDQYSIKYPANWTLTEDDLGATFHILAPKSGPEDKFNENVSLIIQDLSGTNLDLSGYVKLSEEQIRETVKDGNILSSERFESGNFELHKVIYTGEINGFRLKMIQHYQIKEEKAHILTFTAEQSAFEQYKLYGRQVLNSFRFK